MNNLMHAGGKGVLAKEAPHGVKRLKRLLAGGVAAVLAASLAIVPTALAADEVSIVDSGISVQIGDGTYGFDGIPDYVNSDGISDDIVAQVTIAVPDELPGGLVDDNGDGNVTFASLELRSISGEGTEAISGTADFVVPLDEEGKPAVEKVAASLSFEENSLGDGTYFLKVISSADSTDEIASKPFTVDTTAPVINDFKIEGEKVWPIVKKCYKSPVTVKFSITEDNIGSAFLQYEGDEKVSRQLTTDEIEQGFCYLTDAGSYSDFVLEVTDKSGKTTRSELKDSFCINDNNKPSIEIQREGTRVYSSDAPLLSSVYIGNESQITVNEPSEEQPSALDVKITYENGLTDQQEINLEPKNESSTELIGVLANLKEGRAALDMDVKVDEETVRSYSVGWKDNGDGTRSVDVSGNHVVIDKTAPVIDVKWNNNDAQNNSYYKADRIATITVIEANFDASRFDVYDREGHKVDCTWAGDEGDATKHTTTVEFKDGKHQLNVAGEDLAGNKAEKYESGGFVIDTVAPTIAIDWGKNDPSPKTVNDSTVNDSNYYASARKATITITDANFSVDGTPIATGDKGAVIGAWSDEGNGKHTTTVTFDKDGDYALTVSSADLAGNSAAPASSDPFTIDKTAPNSAFEIDATTYETYNGTKYFKDTATVGVVVTEHNFDASNTNVAINDKIVSSKESWVNDGDKHTMTVTLADQGDYTIEVSGTDYAGNGFDKKSQITDKLSVDKTAPVVTSAKVTTSEGRPLDPSATAGDNETFFYNTAATMTINVSDNQTIAKASYVGTKQMSLGTDSSNVMTDGLPAQEMNDPDRTYNATLVISESNSKQGTVTITLKEGSGSTPHKVNEFEENIILTVWDVAGNMRTWSISPQGTVSDVSDSSAANTSINGKQVYPAALVQDLTAPVISISGVTEGTYYNTDQTATLSVEEYNFGYLQLFDGSRTVMTISQTSGDASRSQSTMEVTAKELSGSDPDFSFAQLFDSDGHYVIDAGFEDYATNRSNSVHIGEFTIDKTAPVITVEWDNNDVQNGKYYKAGRTATITVEEHNFDESLFTVATSGATSGWSTNGDTHTMTVACTEDGGVYSLQVSGSDLAGNAADPFTEDEFVVDMTVPEITFSGQFGDHKLEQREGEDVVSDATKGIVKPLITYTDKPDEKGGEPFDTYDATYELVKLDGTSAEVADMPIYDDAVSGGTYNVNFEDFGYLDEPNDLGRGYELEADGVYKLTAHVSDFAGNEADNSIIFSVNRYGSTFVIESVYTPHQRDKEHADEVSDGVVWLAEEPSIVVRTVDVSENVEHYVTVERPDAQAPTLEETKVATSAGNAFKGYTFETINDGDRGWYEYAYTVGSGNFGDGNGGEGAYTVTVSCKDSAGNTSTAESFYNREAGGKVSTGQVAFFLDSVGPEIQMIQPGWAEIGNSYGLQFQVIDEQKLTDEKITLKVDGVELDEAQLQELKDDGTFVGPDSAGNYTMKIGHKTVLSGRKVEVVATDWINRTASASTDTFRVTNLVAEIATCVAVIGGGTAGAVYHYRKKVGNADATRSA